MLLYYILFKPIHAIYNFILRKKDKKDITQKYFFTQKFGGEMVLVGLFFGVIGTLLFFLKNIFSFLEIPAWVFICLGVLILYRGIVKLVAFTLSPN